MDNKEVVQLYKFTPAVYATLEKKVSRNFANVPKDGIEAAYFLGMQHLLGIIREGFTDAA